eukprot:3890782-Amphidinium_carterae.1
MLQQLAELLGKSNWNLFLRSQGSHRVILVVWFFPLTGTEAYRKGLRSFPDLRGTVPWTTDVVAGEASSALTTVLAAERKMAEIAKATLVQEAGRDASTKEFCRDDANRRDCQALDLSNTLAELGPWKVLPGNVCVRLVDARHVCVSDAAVAPLARRWEARHKGVPQQPQVKRVKGLQLPKCLLEGMCHCKRSQEGQAAAKLRDQVRKAMKA